MKFYTLLALLFLMFFSTSFNNLHPIKLTSSLIQVNPKTNKIWVECRVFIDDFTFSMNDTFTKNFNASNLSKRDKDAIESYFEKYYKIFINDTTYPLVYTSSQVFEKQNVLSIKFSKEVPIIKEGDQICVDNSLFFDDFGVLQSNMITIRIPPFISEEYYESTTLDEPITLNL